MSSGLSAHRDGEVLNLILERPEAGNSFSPREAKSLLAFLKKNKDASLIVFKAKGSGIFCAGGDLKYYASLKTKAQGLTANRLIARALNELKRHPARSLAIVEGDCFGGGLELLSAFDEVWSWPSSAFGFWQRRIGLIFGWGGYRRLERRLNPHQLSSQALAAKSITAHLALRMGLVDQIVLPHKVKARTEEWIENHLRLPMEPVKAIKILSGQNEQRLFSSLWLNPSHRGVLSRFAKGKLNK